VILLTACSSVRVLHDDLSCRPIPKQTQAFTDEEVNQTPRTVWVKFKERSTELKERIKTICDDISDHNAEHQKKK
jgi:hypothetical protein